VTVRETFLQTATSARALLGAPGVADRWHEPSALPELSVAGLAGHLVRAVVLVEQYLGSAAPPGARLITADEYCGQLLQPDIHSAANSGVRQRGEAMAAAGRQSLIELLDGTIERLRARLSSEPENCTLEVIGQMPMLLDEYLRTRIVELVVHADDLAVSVGMETPARPPDALTIAIDTLIGAARYRHGDLAVVRALARRERDTIQALRVV